MANLRGTGLSFVCLMIFGVAGCAARDATSARAVAATRLACPASELEVVLNRETRVTREWLAGCDFTYLRVHCRNGRCAPAETPPPCVGEGPCFEENPVTLQWELAKPSVLTGPL
jgi:hypothetical protein